ncbi:MAG: DUF547 domain-containing protein [Bacteroidota bacterium]
MKSPLLFLAIALALSCSPPDSGSHAVEDQSEVETHTELDKEDDSKQQEEATTTPDITDPAEVQITIPPQATVDVADVIDTKAVEPAVDSPIPDQQGNDTDTELDSRQNTDEAEVQPQPTANAPAEPESEDKLQITTDAWADLLRRTVSSTGQVNYASILGEREVLDSYLEATSDGPPAGTLAARAYWINQYNAYTIKLIIDNWPVRSIRDLHGGNPWDVQWISINGENLSLNQIEFEKLRPGDTDARIHFAVNCAATSCPPLHNRLFTASNLNSTLERLSSRFVNNAKYNIIDRSPWQLSSIFDWYGDDFGDVEQFIRQQGSGELGAAGELQFMEYDWSLNN